MLQLFRSFFKSKIGIAFTLVFLAVIAFAFASMDVANTGMFGGVSGGDRVAVVGDERIDASELNVAAGNMLEQMRETNPTLTMQVFASQGGLDRVLDQLLRRTAVAEFAKKFGLPVPCIIDPDMTKFEREMVSGIEGDLPADAIRAAVLAGNASWSGPGKMVNSANADLDINGLPKDEAVAKTIAWLEIAANQAGPGPEAVIGTVYRACTHRPWPGAGLRLRSRLRGALASGRACAARLHGLNPGIHSPFRRTQMVSKNTICLWYNGTALDAAKFYAETFPDSAVGAVHRAPGDYPDGRQGDILTVEFTVMGIPCLGLNGGPAFKHTEAFSFQVSTEDQAETDRLWNAIVGNGGQESACGWCKDKWGLSWQITPRALMAAITDPDPAAAKRAFDAMMEMGKIDIAAIEAARRG